MNSTGFVRGMMSKSMETEMYLTHVVKTIRRQLEKWDERYEVKLQQDLLDETSYEVTCSFRRYNTPCSIRFPNCGNFTE